VFSGFAQPCRNDATSRAGANNYIVKLILHSLSPSNAYVFFIGLPIAAGDKIGFQYPL
jgi:hypothetical protein